MKNIYLLLLLSAFSMQSFGQQTYFKPPELSLIKESELKTDIFDLADDGFRGRRAGTTDELRAAAWVAQKAMLAGLKPAGDDGTYFQYFNIKRTVTSSKSTFAIGSQRLDLWKQFWAVQPIDSRLNGPVVWLNSMADTTQDLHGKLVAVKIVAPSPLPVSWMSLWGLRYTSLAVRQQTTVLRRKGASAIILVANEQTEKSLGFVGHNYQEGSYVLQGSPAGSQSQVPVILVLSNIASALQQPGATITADLKAETYLYPSVNVVAKSIGTDAQLKNQYVLFSGHHDHDGVGTPVGQDSIWNGADDNASVTVAMLAIARAWTAKPGKRSALFVWHGAEERGLLGSRWFAAHPTVDKTSIVAVLNGDMIGRNAPDSAALLGTTSHKNSTQLVDIAMQSNAEITKFKVDFSWDDAKHPENWYFRSDHLPYAQAGIPSIFYTTLLHPDYHTPMDEPDRIDINKLAKMAKWIYATGWNVSQNNEAPALDKK